MNRRRSARIAQYLERLCEQLTERGFEVRGRVAFGDPATELVKVARDEKVDLIAMSTHGHRFLNDLFRGSTADRVRHEVTIPVLMVRAVPHRPAAAPGR